MRIYATSFLARRIHYVHHHEPTSSNSHKSRWAICNSTSAIICLSLVGAGSNSSRPNTQADAVVARRAMCSNCIHNSQYGEEFSIESFPISEFVSAFCLFDCSCSVHLLSRRLLCRSWVHWRAYLQCNRLVGNAHWKPAPALYVHFYRCSSCAAPASSLSFSSANASSERYRHWWVDSQLVASSSSLVV